MTAMFFVDTKDQILRPEEFEGVFRTLFVNVVEQCRNLYEPLRQHLKPPWHDRELIIRIIDNSELNAAASSDSSADYITVNLGAVERIFGTAYGLLSTPSFLPNVGNAAAENKPQTLFNGFPPMPLVRTSRPPAVIATRIPNDPTRLLIAMHLAELAIEFLLFHEIGHVVGGHLEFIGHNTLMELDSTRHLQGPSMSQILECDADLFACDIMSAVQMTDEAADNEYSLAPNVPWSKRDFALLTYCTALGMLFRVFYHGASVDVACSNSTHPHPAVRASLVCSYAFTRAMQRDWTTVSSLGDITAASIRNIEEVWAELILPGQCPKPLEEWVVEVAAQTKELVAAYRRQEHKLDAVARITRVWGSGTGTN